MADTAPTTAAENNADSREIRVFLSSTFRDFNEERKLLATQVFPELNRRARERGVELVEVDLRWGVTQKQAEDGHALEICLQEIERCKPYFMCMLGDSYGSLTPPLRQLLKASPKLVEKRRWLERRIGEASYTELEIEHNLHLADGPADRAFFYFRDPTWSNPKADAGEQGWRSDDPADRKKLDLLRERIRRSGYPLLEGLRDPQAIADQIKEDLWALIDRLFPEGEQPDALQKEARKHADYRSSRTGPGQYVGGEDYIDQLERWLEEGHQQILITGESGAGKSALIANWMERHAQSHPADVVYAHHLGCTNDANALRPLLCRLIDTASQQLLEAEEIDEALAVPENWWELVARVAETLKALGEWCQKRGKRWIWVLDGLDRLNPDDQKALPWLPSKLPNGVRVVASALSCQAREILCERGYTTLTIQPLGREEQEELIQRYLQRYTKELDGGLRQQILAHPLAGSPLFLKVLLEELRQCGRHDTLRDQLGFYLSAQTVDDLYERVMERLEKDGNGEAVRKVMTALWASRAGLTEPDLLAITDLKPLHWAPIDLALEKAFGRNGNRLVFDHDYLRIAVRDRYLPTQEQQKLAHSVLADWYYAQTEWDERKAEELPWQLQKACRIHDLRALLLNVTDLHHLADRLDDREVVNYWRAAKKEGDGELDELIVDAVEEEIEKLKDDAANQICFVDRIADLLDEAGLYRELLLRLRTLSLELEEAREDKKEESILSSLAWLARTHLDMGHYNEAEQLYLRCLEARERLLGVDAPKTLAAMLGLARTYHRKEAYNIAEHYYARCLESRERVLGPEHPATLRAVNNLGLLNADKGDYQSAESLYKRALDAKERLLGRDHPSTLVTLSNLAGIYRRQGQYEKAEESYLRILQAREDLLGTEHPDTLKTVGNLGLFYKKKGDYRQAEDYYLRCLRARERLLGSDHPATNVTRFSLANLLSDQERYEESIALRRKELDVIAKRDGRNAAGTLTSIHHLAEDLYWNNKLKESEKLYREAVEGRILLFGDDDDDTMASLYGLARCLSKQKRYEEAIVLRRLELSWCRLKDGDTDRGTLTSINGLAIDLRETGALEEAEALFRELLAVRQQVLRPSNFGIGQALGDLAKTLEKAGKLEEAVCIAQQALEHRFEHEGRDAWWTNRERLDLARVLSKLGRLVEALSLLDQLEMSMRVIIDLDNSDRKLLEEAQSLRTDLEASRSDTFSV